MKELCISLFLQERKELYFAECLRIVSENTARLLAANGVSGASHIGIKLEDILHPKAEAERNPQEIIDSIHDKLDRIRESGGEADEEGD